MPSTSPSPWIRRPLRIPTVELCKKLALILGLLNGLILGYLISGKVWILPGMQKKSIYVNENDSVSWWSESDKAKVQNQTEFGFESTPCDVDSECYRFRQLMASWPAAKPKAAIYVLTEPHKRGNKTKDMLASLFKYFNDKYRYPIIIFHTGEWNITSEMLPVSIPREVIFLQRVIFPLPPYLAERRTICPHGLGYRHMCRFHANTVYTHPILQDLEFAWRLDDDSLLLGPNIEYDVFKFMRDRGLLYGFITIDSDILACVVDLWEAAEDYTKQLHIKSHFLDKWPRYKMFYNNFEISNVSIWRTEEYRGFVEHIDDLGGIYKYRWSDAPIKSLALAMFVSPEKIHQFKHIGYQHQLIKIPGLHNSSELHLLATQLRVERVVL